MKHRARTFGKRWTGALVLGAALVVVAGCATGPRIVHTEVTSFDDWSALPADKSYVFARTLEFQNSVELASYENLVRDELAAHSFRLVADPAQATLVVTLRPSVTGTAVSVRERWPIDPFFYGRFGGPYYGSFGYPFGGFYNGGFYGGGFYGGGLNGGFYDGFGDARIQIFKRRLEVDIDARSLSGKRYYEGRVESTGDDGSLPRAMPTLVRALFSDFPGNNGQTRRVDVPLVPVANAPR